MKRRRRWLRIALVTLAALIGAGGLTLATCSSSTAPGWPVGPPTGFVTRSDLEMVDDNTLEGPVEGGYQSYESWKRVKR